MDEGLGITIALDKAFPYKKARQYLIYLGRALGYEKMLEWYDLRRGTGQKLNGLSAAPSSIRTMCQLTLPQRL